MRLSAIALASLLLACTVADENAATDGQGGNDLVSSNLPAPVETQPANGNASAPPGQQPSNGETPADPAGEIGFRALPLRVNAGATVTLRLANGTSQRLGYNLCTSTLQTGGGENVRTDRVCTMELRTLAPGSSTTYPYDLPGDLKAGTYRFTAKVERMGSATSTTVTSNSFQVQ